MFISKRHVCVLLIVDAFLVMLSIIFRNEDLLWPNVLRKLLALVLILSVCAQVQLSLALYDLRRKRVADEGDCLLSGDAADSESQQLNETFNITTRYDDDAAAHDTNCNLSILILI